MPVYKARLSTKSISDLQNALLNYKKGLTSKVDLFLSRLAEIGADEARLSIQRLDAIFTGELLESIRTEPGGRKEDTVIFYVIADSKHAVFVEFGTGQMGQESPYPHPFPNGIEWEYNSGKTIIEIAPGKYGWFYTRDGNVYFTQGMESRPFMYEAGMEMRLNVERIAREVFR